LLREGPIPISKIKEVLKNRRDRIALKKKFL
jgi:hypothetical protein